MLNRKKLALLFTIIAAVAALVIALLVVVVVRRVNYGCWFCSTPANANAPQKKKQSATTLQYTAQIAQPAVLTNNDATGFGFVAWLTTEDQSKSNAVPCQPTQFTIQYIANTGGAIDWSQAKSIDVSQSDLKVTQTNDSTYQYQFLPGIQNLEPSTWYAVRIIGVGCSGSVTSPSQIEITPVAGTISGPPK
jgi:hypothetical protein